MPKGNEAGLSFADAVLAAQAEIEGSPEDASTSDNVLEQELVATDEHLADDSQDDTEGLFAPLFEDDDDNTTNTPYVEDSAVIVIDGESMTLDEAKKGFMRHDDYTRKTQDLANQRQAVQNAVTLWEALENDPITTLRTLNARLGSGGSLLDAQPLVAPRQPQGTSAVSVNAAVGNVDDLVEQKVAERLAADPRIAEYEAQKAKTILDGVFAKIEADWNLKLSDQDKFAVLNKAKAMNTTDLEMVFAGLMSLVSRKKAQRQIVKQGATLTGRGFVDGDEVPNTQETPADFKDAIKQAMRDLRVQDLTNLK